jgi:hypothetical protein
LPFTPNTVTVTSLPIITVSPTRLVKINIIQLLANLALAAATNHRAAQRLATSTRSPMERWLLFPTRILQSIGQEYKNTKRICCNFLSE